MSFDNMKFRTKSLVPLVVMAIAICAMVGFNARQMTDFSRAASDVIERRDVAVDRLIRASRLVTTIPYSVLGSLAYDASKPEGHLASEGYAASFAKATDLFEQAMGLAPDKAPAIEQFKARFKTLFEESKKPFKIGEDTPGLSEGSKLAPADLDQMSEGARLMGELDIRFRTLVDDIARFDDAFIGENAQAAADLRAQSSSVIVLMVGAGVLAVLLAAAVSLWISTVKMTRPLVRLAEGMRTLARGDLTVELLDQGRRDEIGGMSQAVQIFKSAAVEKLRLEADAVAAGRLTEAERAQTAAALAEATAQQAHVVELVASGLSRLSGGDLEHRIDEHFPAEYEKLRTDFNGAMAKLQDTMRTVAASASAIRSGTGEISTASDDLSRRTEQQAASLEETAAALDEITATVRRTAEGSKHARAVVGSARGNAEQSGLVVRQAVEAMSGIEKSSREISQIIGVIDEIAFQTSLLALNAGVEAARAGDAGRGFAVVASEVRALAQRSAEAAKEIKALISTSGVQVQQGVTFVGQAGEALVRIVAQVTEIDGIVGEIASSAQEQATGLDQVNTAVNQMDQVTQQNAAMVEQSTAASHALTQETGELTRLIGEFRLGGEAPPARRASSPVTRIERRPVAAPVSALRAVGRGGAARAPDAASPDADWAEF